MLNENPSSAPQSAIPDPHSAIASHAIRRWRAHIPRPPRSPEPDPSWRDECPCGHQLPCPDHPELARQVRGYRPQNPSYAEELTRVGLPVYVPTPEELGCPRELYERSLGHHYPLYCPAELLPFIDPAKPPNNQRNKNEDHHKTT